MSNCPSDLSSQPTAGIFCVLMDFLDFLCVAMDFPPSETCRTLCVILSFRSQNKIFVLSGSYAITSFFLVMLVVMVWEVCCLMLSFSLSFFRRALDVLQVVDAWYFHKRVHHHNGLQFVDLSLLLFCCFQLLFFFAS